MKRSPADPRFVIVLFVRLVCVCSIFVKSIFEMMYLYGMFTYGYAFKVFVSINYQLLLFNVICEVNGLCINGLTAPCVLMI